MSTQKKVIVTGCSGFLGHHVMRACRMRGWDVVGIDKRNIPSNHWMPEQFIQADVFDLGYRDLAGADFVIHLAFSTNIPNSIRHPKETTYQNIDMTVHLLEVCKEAGVKKVFFPSTASLYGNNPTPWEESMKCSPQEPYSFQKLSCEILCKMYSLIYGVDIVIGRFFQIYGELQREDTALAAFLKAKKNGEPITLTETTAQSSFKSGQRDFIYAGDVADAVCLMLEKGENGGIYNVSSGKVHTMEEIADALKSEVKWIPRRGWEVEKHLGDITKIKKLGWEPKTSVISWLKNYAQI